MILYNIVRIFLMTMFVTTAAGAIKEIWEKPGCHKVGHTRKISIPDCIEFHMTTNACRGYCESWTVPTESRKAQPLTSMGHCCNIMETEDVPIEVFCLDGPKTITFKSATSCACYHCKKN